MTRFPLRRLRLRTGDEHREPVTLALDPFELGGQRYEPSPSDVDAELVVDRATGGDVFRLSFTTRLEGPCVRCLREAAVDVRAAGMEVHDPAAHDEQLRSDYVVEDELDLSAWARDLVALELPDQILCRPGCAGLCAVCGLDLNEQPHEHADESTDPRWAALEALRDDV